jgi:ubiquinone/menaquinone biosynthesis C-methylase UbiE
MKVVSTKFMLAVCVLLSASLPVAARGGAGIALQQRRTSRPTQRRPRRLRAPDVIFVPTPPETVEEMLRQARLRKGDVLFDLGSGDGRIPIAAAKQYGVRAVGIDIDPQLVAEATEAAKREGLGDLVTFRLGDMFAADLTGATVVTLYLSDTLNVMLRPKLLRELRPGSRIVSHDFRMGDWPPEKAVRVPWKNLYRTVYVWTVPRGGRYKKDTFKKLR